MPNNTGWNLDGAAGVDFGWAMNDPAAKIDPTIGASSQLDTGGGLWASVQGSLGQLLDAYTNIEVAKMNANALPGFVPAGYQRVPGTSQVVPAGTVTGARGGMSMTTMLLIGGGLLAAVLLLRKG